MEKKQKRTHTGFLAFDVPIYFSVKDFFWEEAKEDSADAVVSKHKTVCWATTTGVMQSLSFVTYTHQKKMREVSHIEKKKIVFSLVNVVR